MIDSFSLVKIFFCTLPVNTCFCKTSLTIFAMLLQFVEKAPEQIVREAREKSAEAEEKITLTKNRLALLKSTVAVAE